MVQGIIKNKATISAISTIQSQSVQFHMSSYAFDRVFLFWGRVFVPCPSHTLQGPRALLAHPCPASHPRPCPLLVHTHPTQATLPKASPLDLPWPHPTTPPEPPQTTSYKHSFRTKGKLIFFCGREITRNCVLEIRTGPGGGGQN